MVKVFGTWLLYIFHPPSAFFKSVPVEITFTLLSVTEDILITWVELRVRKPGWPLLLISSIVSAPGYHFFQFSIFETAFNIESLDEFISMAFDMRICDGKSSEISMISIEKAMMLIKPSLIARIIEKSKGDYSHFITLTTVAYVIAIQIARMPSSFQQSKILSPSKDIFLTASLY